MFVCNFYLVYLPLVWDKLVDYLALHMHIHPVDYIAALVRVNRISPVALDIGIHHHIAVAVDNNNSHPMNYRQLNAKHQHGRLLQMPQSKEIAAKHTNDKHKKQERKKNNKIKPLIRIILCTL